MVKARPAQVAFNAGEFGPEMVARIDYEKYPFAGRLVKDWLAITQGGMRRRPKLGILWRQLNNNVARLYPFEFSTRQAFVVEITEGFAQFGTADGKVQAGTFTGALGGLTDTSINGGSSSFAGGLLSLLGTPGGMAGGRFTVATPASRVSLAFTVDVGRVFIRVGSTVGDDDLIARQELLEGSHVITWDSTGTNHIEIYHRRNADYQISNLAFVNGGDVTVSHPYVTDDLFQIMGTQVGDVVRFAHPSQPPYRLVRRDNDSWSFEREWFRNGPYGAVNDTEITVSVSDLRGMVTVTASDGIFNPGHVGMEWRVRQPSQRVEVSPTADDQFSDPVRIAGEDEDTRRFRVIIDGNDGRVRLQRSLSENGPFSEVRSYGDNTENDDRTDNDLGVPYYYRVGYGPGDYGGGNPILSIEYPNGDSTGRFRVTEFINDQTVRAEITKVFAQTDASAAWEAPAWSDEDGWPSTVQAYNGRVWYGRGITLWSSRSDDFSNFEAGLDPEDAIDRTVISGRVDAIQVLAATDDLISISEGAETVGRSDEFRGVITPTNFNTRMQGSTGASPVQPVVVDGSVLYADRHGTDLTEFAYRADVDRMIPFDLSVYHDELLFGGIRQFALQMKPHRRLWMVTDAGELFSYNYERSQNINGFCRVTVNGYAESVACNPTIAEDRVFVSVLGHDGVRRVQILGSEVFRHGDEEGVLNDAISTPLETPDTSIEFRWNGSGYTVVSRDPVFNAGDAGRVIRVPGFRLPVLSVTDGRTVTVAGVEGKPPSRVLVPGGRWTLSPQPSTVVSGLDELEGRMVSVYADGVFHVDQQTITGGAINLASPASFVSVGEPVTSRYESMKMPFGEPGGTGLTQKKRGYMAGLLLHRAGPEVYTGYSSPQRIEAGQDRLSRSPESRNLTEGDLFTGEWEIASAGNTDRDTRLIIEARGAYPATIFGAVVNMETYPNE